MGVELIRYHLGFSSIWDLMETVPVQIAVWPLILHLQTGALIWLVLGGLFYSGGVIFFSIDQEESPRKGFGHHEIWHVFVLAGSASHYWVMYHYIAQY